MITIRKKDWQERLTAYIRKVELRKFKYGTHDCIIFSAGAFNAVTGLNALQGIPKYKNTKEAVAMLTEYKGVFKAVDTALLRHPVESKEPGFAVPGDIVGFVNHEGEETVGVVFDIGSIAAVGKQGLEFIPIHPNAIRCWSV